MPADPSKDAPSNESDPQSTPTTNHEDFWIGPRSRRQFSFFLLGAACVSLSIFSTRRALLRRYHATVPHFYQQSNAPPREPFSLQREAVEALRIATVNVFSFSLMCVGGGLWAADISGMGELKERLRRMKKEREGRMRGTRDEEKDMEAEREFEEFLGPSLKKGKKRAEKGRGEDQ
ncbi:MAG: hypothetical protein LQ352_006673 [Teloschistes flavicans]|nr:MAG: hypothetical protein LQ352_006673 [Teloschistes flavicans]